MTTQTIRLSPAEQIYHLYPKKVGKVAAMKAINAALRSISFNQLMECVAEFAEIAEKARRTERWQFVPHPSTWFNQGRWDDDRDEWRNMYEGEQKKQATPQLYQYRRDPQTGALVAVTNYKRSYSD